MQEIPSNRTATMKILSPYQAGPSTSRESGFAQVDSFVRSTEVEPPAHRSLGARVALALSAVAVIGSGGAAMAQTAPAPAPYGFSQLICQSVQQENYELHQLQAGKGAFHLNMVGTMSLRDFGVTELSPAALRVHYENRISGVTSAQQQKSIDELVARSDAQVPRACSEVVAPTSTQAAPQ